MRKVLPLEPMKWLDRIMKGRKPPTYAKAVGVVHSQIYKYLERNNSKIEHFLSFLCKARKESGETWNQFGKKLDEEYLDKQNNHP